MGAVKNFYYGGKRASSVGSEILDGVWVTAVTPKELSEQNQTFLSQHLWCIKCFCLFHFPLFPLEFCFLTNRYFVREDGCTIGTWVFMYRFRFFTVHFLGRKPDEDEPQTHTGFFCSTCPLWSCLKGFMSAYNTEICIWKYWAYTGFFSFLAVIEAVLEKIARDSEASPAACFWVLFTPTCWSEGLLQWLERVFLHIEWAVVYSEWNECFCWNGGRSQKCPCGFFSCSASALLAVRWGWLPTSPLPEHLQLSRYIKD